MDELSNYIRSIITIDNNDLEYILSHFKEVTIKSNDYVLKKNQLSTNYYFIKSGGVRIWFEKDEKPITAWLIFENSFFSELSSLKSRKPTQFNIQAVTDTVLLAIEKNSMEHLYERIAVWQRFGRLIWENSFLRVIDGIINHQTLTAEERYLAAMQQSNLIQKIPLKQLASFLGMTPTSLSRIRKKISE
ncbi:MAG: Crp/Fnr family transcriptional regulator [Ginsengibacter sp.]